MNDRHFLTLLDFSSTELHELIERAIHLKSQHRDGIVDTSLKGKVLAMVFEKSSTRTRVSFEAGMAQLGGHAIFLSPKDTQFGRGEPIEDSARVLSRMSDIIMIRTFEHEKIERFAEFSIAPVINALTDMYHPCQLLADMQTWIEHRGDIRGATVTFVGDGNNMCHSYINAARQFGFTLHAATPEDYKPDAALVAAAGDSVKLFTDPAEAAKDSQLLVTDVWASMGQEEEQRERMKVFKNYQINESIMALADKDALFMHCLPAHRGEEVTAGVIDGQQSVVWDEAENRLHAQKALLQTLLNVS